MALFFIFIGYFIRFAIELNEYRGKLRNKEKIQKKLDLMGLFPFKSGACMILSILTTMLISHLIMSDIRAKVKHHLKNITSDSILTIDGKAMTNMQSIVDELLKVKHIPPNHSHPEKEFIVKILNNSKMLTLKVGRDSRKKDEYWIFYPKYFVSSSNEVWKIRSHIFDEI